MVCATRFIIHSTRKSFLTFKGFTLIELLVVLLIFSLLAGLVAPRLSKMYASWQMTLERDEVLTQLSSLNYHVFQQHIDFTLTDYPSQSEDKPENKPEVIAPLLELPAGWQINTKQPIIFRANGACGGGIVYLKYSEYTFTAQLEPPFCRAKLLN